MQNEIHQPRFNIGDTVFVYANGELKETRIRDIDIRINEKGHSIGYQFKESRSFMNDFFISEKEVFASREEFYKKFAVNA